MTGRSLRFSLLSHLQQCTIRPLIVHLYEREPQNDVAQWLHNQYQRYAIRIYDLRQLDRRYHIALLDLKLISGDELLLFPQRAPEDAFKMLPRRSGNRRLVAFLQIRYSFIEDEYIDPLLYKHMPDAIQ